MGIKKSLNLFSTLVTVTDTVDLLGDHASLIEGLAAMRRDEPGIKRSNYGGGWHSKTGLHSELMYSNLVGLINTHAADYAGVLGVPADLLRIVEMWAVISGKGAYNEKHTHPHAFLSGAYYLQADDRSSPIKFHDPRPVKAFVTSGSTNSNPYLSNCVVVKPKAGRLVLFPSWLEHGVAPNESDNERIVVSFNIGLNV